jgi:tRNA G18 (ribose-2'-O)-methylase SpoU
VSLSRAQRQRIDRIAKGRSEEGLFLLEGRRAVHDALRIGVVAEVWVRRDLEDAHREPLEDAARDANVLLFEAGVADFDRMGKTVSPQGVFALVRDTRTSLEEVLAQPGWLLWLDGVQDPGNVGAVVRVAVAFGAGGLLVSEGGAHPLGFKALRASSGIALQVPFAREEAARLAETLRASTRPTWILERGGQDVFSFPETPEDFVLVIGSEGRGACAEARDGADGLLGIPIDPRVESLNAAVAAGIAVAQLTQTESRHRG